MAMWTARVTAEANNHSLAPYRDSTASKVKGEEERRKKGTAKRHLRTAGLSASSTKKKQSVGHRSTSRSIGVAPAGQA